MSIERMGTNRRMSQIVVHGETVYLAGQVADDTSADLRGQVQQVLRKIDALLAQVGSNKGKLVAANIWLANMGDFQEMNQVWEAWVPEGSAPTRATVEARLVSAAHRVEIAVIAAR